MIIVDLYSICILFILLLFNYDDKNISYFYKVHNVIKIKRHIVKTTLIFIYLTIALYIDAIIYKYIYQIDLYDPLN
jgi:hypothetical protein